MWESRKDSLMTPWLSPGVNDECDWQIRKRIEKEIRKGHYISNEDMSCCELKYLYTV